MTAVRLCLCLEHTSAMHAAWPDIRGQIVEPVLRSISGQGTCELALVLFGAPSFSSALVRSSQWIQEASELRQWLDEVDFSGGGCHPVALAEALLEAACLFELPSLLPQQPQNHCLLCMVSDPASSVVSWPFPSAHGKWSRLPGLATSAELMHALPSNHMVSVGLATRLRTQQQYSPPLIYHMLHTLAQPQVPPTSVEVFTKEHQGEWLALNKRTARTAGGSVAVLPHWEQGWQAVMQYNAGKAGQFNTGRTGASPGGLDTPSPQLESTNADTPGTMGPPDYRGNTPQPAMPPAVPKAQTPPPSAAAAAAAVAAAYAAGPGAPAMPPRTGGFMELISMPSAIVAATGAGQPPQPPTQQLQYLPPQPHQAVVQQGGNPMQPTMHQSPMQSPTQPPAAGRTPPPQQQQQLARNIGIAWWGQLVVADRVRGSMPPHLGTIELIARTSDMQRLSMLPPIGAELMLSKIVSMRHMSAELQKLPVPPVQMHLRVREYREGAEGTLMRMAVREAAGLIDLLNGYKGALIIFPKQAGGGEGQGKISMRLAVYKA